MQYFQHIEHILAETYQKRDTERKAGTLDRAKDYRQFTAIKNIGKGHKFALHHDGTLIPSRGEMSWQKDLDK